MNLTKKSKAELDKITLPKNRKLYVPEQIAEPHKFTRNTQSAFEKMIKKVANVRESKKLPNDFTTIVKSIYRGRFICRNANCFHVTVSEYLVNRAIRFLDTLAKELENRKFKIQFIQNNAGSFVVAIKDNEHISFNISEGYKYLPIKNEHRSELEKALYRDREPIPTGRLTLTILARETRISNSWSDGKKLIEDALPAIIKSFENLVLRQKQRKFDNKLISDRRREESILFKEIESRQYAEKAIYDKAIQEARDFIAHRDLDAYLNHLEEKYIEKYGNFNEETLPWFSTVRKLSEAQNPVKKRLSLLGDYPLRHVNSKNNYL